MNALSAFVAVVGIIAAVFALFFAVSFWMNTAHYGYSGAVAAASPMIWPLFMLIPHRHRWRRLTGKADYGRYGRHWGGCHGQKEDECWLCGAKEYAERHEDAQHEKEA